MTFEIVKDPSGLMTKEIILHSCNVTDAFLIVHWEVMSRCESTRLTHVHKYIHMYVHIFI